MKKIIHLAIVVLAFTNIALGQNFNNHALIKSSASQITAKKDSLNKNLRNTKTAMMHNSQNKAAKHAKKLQQNIPSSIPINEKEIREKLTQQLPSTDVAKEKLKQAIPTSNATKKVYYIANNAMNGTFDNSIVPQKLEKSVHKLQNSPLKKIWDRTVYSFDIGLVLGQNSNLFRFTPTAGVRITKYYTMGIGVPMQYTNFNQNFNQKGFEDLMYGVKLYHRLHLPKGIYLQIDGDFLNSSLSENQTRQWIPAMWTGFGYNKKLSKHFGASIMVMYNTLYKENYTPYSLPLDIRVGFNWYQPTKPIIGMN